jgi:hypothetical protein
MPVSSLTIRVQRNIVRKSIAATFIAGFALLSGCSDEYSTENYRVGTNGEPPKALKLVYTQKFVAEQKNYVRALGEIHAFLIESGFFPVVYKSCFGDVLDIRVTADIEKHKRAFPCVAVQATKSDELINIYFRVSIDDVKFNQLDHDNRLMFTVEMFGREDVVGAFGANVAPSLAKLYPVSSTRKSMLPHNNSLQTQRP